MDLEMRVLGFISSFDELADPNPRLGRKIAGYGLTAALIEYADYDQLHFFLPFPRALEYFQEGYGPWLNESKGSGRVQCLLAKTMPRAMGSVPYEAMHAGAVDNYLPELCHLRNRYAGEPFPVTFTPHSLNYWDSLVRSLYKVLPGALEYDAIFCTSRAARDHYRKSFSAAAAELEKAGLSEAGFKGRLDLAPLGVRCEEFGRENRGAARRLWGLPENAVALLALGRLTPADKYDLEPLLGVMALLDPHPPVHLILAGADWQGYGAYLAGVAKDLGFENRVHLFTDFDPDTKAAIYAAADIFVSPADNLQETFGLNIVEAMAAGLPVVASDFSGYRDLVVDGETGYLIPTTGPLDYEPVDATWPVCMGYIAGLEVAQRTAVDFDLLFDRISRLTGSADLRFKLGRAGKQRARAEFDWRVIVRRMTGLWQTLKQEALAQGIPRPIPHVLGYGRRELFNHFFSQSIQPGSVVIPGPLSGKFLDGKWAVQSLPELIQPSPAPGMMKMLQVMEQTGPLTLNELTAILGHEIPAHQVEYLVLWGLKYGILSQKSHPVGGCR